MQRLETQEQRNAVLIRGLKITFLFSAQRLVVIVNLSSQSRTKLQLGCFFFFSSVYLS